MTETLLRLRADTYYMPVRDGVWIRTTAGSFTLRGANAAAWVQQLAPLLDQGVEPDRLYASLRPEQVGYVRKLIGALESRQVLRREPDSEDPVLAGAFPQQMEFLRHFTPDAQAALARVRRTPVAVAGTARRANLLAATLAETGFADIALLGCEPDEDLAELAEEYAAHGTPVRFTTTSDAEDRLVVGVFATGEEDLGFALADRAAAAGTGAWLGLVRGQAMLLKGQRPGSGTACVRCAWRRLVHAVVALPPSEGLGHTQVSVAGAVLGQELFQHVATGRADRLAEGVVVDLTRLSIWRTAIDPDPGCPAADVHRDDPEPEARQGKFPDVVFGARCFGPLVSCSPKQYRQLPLAVVRLQANPLGRTEPAAPGDGPLIVAETMAAARHEAVLLAVRETVSGQGIAPGTPVEVGLDPAEALGRALVRHAETHLAEGWAPAEPAPERHARARLASLAGEVPAVTVESHPSGLWRATVGGHRPLAGLDAEHAEERALLSVLGATQLGDEETAPVPAAGRAAADPDRICSALGLSPRPVVLPALVSGHLAGVAL
ncbi:hypothetical protein [Amycolatopsis saalfeldensis]|uniref:Thiazole-containing bacteriocin maturation protein n=1 Tax=Amycolatopsis saalfeldensis TaxID=394193 RepID=A0A1H8TGI8_9PSEU|nr:hypothetical protein [Amycolatopsis saalfeldensis]SEO90032.1 hypothetical protein SAMN04489732_102611 [Amycolatopsis saalfeldensis]